MENNRITTITVGLDATEEFVDCMNQAYPKVLEKSKELCEK